MALDDSRIEQITGPRILVIGDIMLDRYWFGAVDRISPEAPVPVVLVQERQERMGGAGNVALNIRSLGGNCTLLGIVGDDEAGHSLERIASENGVVTDFVVDVEAPTSIKQRIVSRNQQLIRADFEGKPGKESVNELVGSTAELLKSHDVVILSDYGKGSLALVQDLITMAGSDGTPVLVDPKGADFSRYSGATLITPNLKEFELVVGKIDDDNTMSEAAMELINSYNIKSILVTLSEKGMRVFDRDGSDYHSPARSREVYDVSGAGDTVIAVMAMSIGAGFNTHDSLQVANSAAGVVVSKLGTATATMNELKRAMSRDFGDTDN